MTEFKRHTDGRRMSDDSFLLVMSLQIEELESELEEQSMLQTSVSSVASKYHKWFASV